MKNKINSIQFASMLLLIIISSSIGLTLHTAIFYAGIDAYIAIILSFIIGFIPLSIFLFIFNYQENLNINDKIFYLFGKKFGYLINFSLNIIIVIIAITILFNLSNFIVSQYLSDTPLILISFTFLLVIYNIINKDIETISRVSSIFSIITLFLFIFSFLYLIRQFNLDNIKPILENGIKGPLKSSIINALITLSPIYSLLIIPKDSIVDKEKVNKYIIYGYIIGYLVIFLVVISSSLTLGKYLISLYQYPGYTSLKKISIFGFIDRIENFMSLHWILSNFICLSMLLYYINKSISHHQINKKTNLIIILIINYLSIKVFINNTIFNNYTYKIYPFILLFMFSIYLVILFTYLIKKKK